MKNVLIIGAAGLLGSNWAIKWKDRYNIFLGYLVTIDPNFIIIFSIILGSIIALELGSHFNNEINAGSIVRDRIHAQQIPKASVIPYPFIPVRGEKINDRKARDVVIDVNEIGRNK